MKAAIVSIISNVSKSLTHHGGGYARIMVKILRDYHPDISFDLNPDPSEWKNYDKLFLCEGVNFQGIPIAQIGDQIIRAQNKIAYNIPGGPQEEHYKKIDAIANYTKDVVFVNNIFEFDVFSKRLKKNYDQWPKQSYKNYAIDYGVQNRKCVIGDSHSLSVWKVGFGLDRTDGKTLWNFLNTSNPEEINAKFDETITYFGNIDVRFHLHRQSDPEAATRDLFNRYVEFSKRLKNNTVVVPLPVEHESRKLPGTGLYKGEPFFGTREERMKYRQIGIDILKSSGIKLIEWPESWSEGDGTKMFEYMEPRQSVHLKPKYYAFANEIL